MDVVLNIEGLASSAAVPASRKAVDEARDSWNFVDDPDALRIREYRHRLQKAFLGRHGWLKHEDMPSYDSLFTTVEELEMNAMYLNYSKIGKVMRHIALLSSEKVPRDEEFKFRSRAKALVDKWHPIVVQDKARALKAATASEDGEKSGDNSIGGNAGGDETESKDQEDGDNRGGSGDRDRPSEANGTAPSSSGSSPQLTATSPPSPPLPPPPPLELTPEPVPTSTPVSAPAPPKEVDIRIAADEDDDWVIDDFNTPDKPAAQGGKKIGGRRAGGGKQAIVEYSTCYDADSFLLVSFAGASPTLV